ncbi:hypothetical protein B488_07570 [Liberibacter crescens BT-1]|uniref:Uncharacterized protein n=1 Tax=Liberibacter crescens (strain BT-1) TaxID=1215343 RepID=L0ET85_LIBCB|nr:hypothetical protein B488_07570 [Liberibacter crescens BT-1]
MTFIELTIKIIADTPAITTKIKDVFYFSGALRDILREFLIFFF